jgi:hypothetical protein
MRCKVARIHESSDKGIENRLRLLPWEEIKAAIFKDRGCAAQIGSRTDDINPTHGRLHRSDDYGQLFSLMWSSPDVVGLFSINVVSFSRNVVLRDPLFSLNSVSKLRMLSVRAVYVLSSLHLIGQYQYARRSQQLAKCDVYNRRRVLDHARSTRHDCRSSII